MGDVMGETVHVVPVDDLIEHDTSGEKPCVCGPDVEHVEAEDGDGWLVTHHSLDGRERFEEEG
jgi:hypothetical protein